MWILWREIQENVPRFGYPMNLLDEIFRDYSKGILQHMKVCLDFCFPFSLSHSFPIAFSLYIQAKFLKYENVFIVFLCLVHNFVSLYNSLAGFWLIGRKEIDWKTMSILVLRSDYLKDFKTNQRAMPILLFSIFKSG